MKAEDFYKILTEADKVLKNAGFSKRGKNRYLKDNSLELLIQLDKHGWDPKFGWGFHARAYDVRGVDKSNYEMPQHAKEIRPLTLVDESLLGQPDLEALYAEYLESRPELYEQVKRSWFAFYDEAHLRNVLEKLLPLIANSTLDWFENLPSE